MNKEDYKFIICDTPDKEELVCQIFCKNEFWAEISAEAPNEFVVEFYQHKGRKRWQFPFDDAMKVLQKAKSLLAKFQRTPEEQARYEAKMEAQRKKWYGDENTQ